VAPATGELTDAVTEVPPEYVCVPTAGEGDPCADATVNVALGRMIEYPMSVIPCTELAPTVDAGKI
jgi:hypothetical protein